MSKADKKKNRKRKKQGRPRHRGERQVLSDHVRRGRRLVPPLADYPNVAPLSWVKDVLPQVVWIGLLVDRFKAKRAMEIALSVVKAAVSVDPGSRKTERDDDDSISLPLNPCAADWYVALGKEARVELVGSLSEGDRLDLQEALLPLVAMYPECPLSFLVDEVWRASKSVDPEESLGVVSRVVADAADKGGQLATHIHGGIFYCLAVTQLLHVADRDMWSKFPTIQEYPATEDSRIVASFVRAMVNAQFGAATSSAWSKYFWRQGFDISVCRYAEPKPAQSGDVEAFFDRLVAAAQSLAGTLPRELGARWAAVKPDLADPTRGEVLGGLLARQTRLCCAIAADPHLWSPDIGRILLRCMVDTYIALRWLAEKGTDDDIHSFVEHGLGQEKLLLEHVRATLPDEVRSAGHPYVEETERWINSQLFTFLLPVTLGQWKSPRDMAAELGALDIYNLEFAPYSASVHGAWNAIARLNLRVCINPLHRFHRTPTFQEAGFFLDTPSIAVDLMRRTSESWCTAVGQADFELATVKEFVDRLSEQAAIEL